MRAVWTVAVLSVCVRLPAAAVRVTVTAVPPVTAVLPVIAVPPAAAVTYPVEK